jgi:transposase
MMTNPPAKIHTALGLDVSQDSVTLYDSRTRQTLTIDNRRETLINALTPLADRDLAICEATGGHEDVLLGALHTLGIPAHRADAAKVKAFIRSFGKRAKTDPIDARWLAQYGLDRAAKLALWQPPEACQRQIEALVARRLDLVAMRRQEQCRLKAPRTLLADDIAGHIAELDTRIRIIESQIQNLIAQHEQFATRDKALRSVPGISHVLAPLLIATMPELGSINRHQAASLAGCAPHPKDSGKTNAYRHSSGGRRQLRPPLFIAALAATRGDNPLASFYQNLLNAGKPKRLALAAVMRKIITVANARVRDALYPDLTARLT